VLDFETTTYGKGLPIYEQNSVVCASWFVSATGQHKFLRGSEFEMAELVEDVRAADFLVAHNAKFELGWLGRCGYPVEDGILVYDTMIAEYVIGGNRWKFADLALGRCGERHGLGSKVDIVSMMIKGGVSTTDIPASLLEEYCSRDVQLCRLLYVRQLGIFEVWPKLLNLVYTRCLLTPVLVDMEGRGLKLDAAKVLPLCEAAEKEYSDNVIQMNTITGGINVNSGKQLAEYLYDVLEFKHTGKLTPGGKRSTAEATISALRPRTAKQKKFLDLYKRGRELSNTLTKYLRKFKACCEDSGGILMAQFNQTATFTHRLSSTGLEYSTQFQNLPREYKPLFMAKDEGWQIAEADGSQLEFRVAAHLGRDQVALSDIVSKKDVHAATAEYLSTTRQEAKAHTFKPLYGGTRGTKEQVAYYEYFNDRYSGIVAAQNEWKNHVLEHKVLDTEWGMRFYWPTTEMQASGYITNSTSICNYPVQSFATAEIIPIAVVYLHYLSRYRNVAIHMVNTVHDSAVAEVHKDAGAEFVSLSKLCFIDVVYWYLEEVYGIKMTVPLGVGVGIGTHWGDSEAKDSEIKIDATKEYYEQ